MCKCNYLPQSILFLQMYCIIYSSISAAICCHIIYLIVSQEKLRPDQTVELFLPKKVYKKWFVFMANIWGAVNWSWRKPISSHSQTAILSSMQLCAMTVFYCFVLLFALCLLLVLTLDFSCSCSFAVFAAASWAHLGRQDQANCLVPT